MKKSTLLLGSIFFAVITVVGLSCSTRGGLLGGGKPKLHIESDGPGPSRIFIEGGTFLMGGTMNDGIPYANDVFKRQVTVASFLMDEHEITNGDWVAYLNDIQSKFPNDYEIYYRALPDTLVWRNPLSYNEPYVDLYLRHAAFQDYPVVGITWEQANDYAYWRTDTLHSVRSMASGAGNGGGVIQPFRLPTEAEWEYAANAVYGQRLDKANETQGNIYPWGGVGVRATRGKKSQGMIMANFKLAQGSNTGVAGYRNDGGDITTPVKSYWPNEFGLFDMAGNVNEWVGDVYRELSYEDFDDFNPYRGNVYLDKAIDPQTGEELKDKYGRPIRVPAKTQRKQTWEELQASQNIQVDSLNGTEEIKPYRHDLRGYLDEENNSLYGRTSLINNKSRVYKGGSWNDLANWLNPAARRHMQQDESSSMVGFRLVMTAVGPPPTQRLDGPRVPKNPKRPPVRN